MIIYTDSASIFGEEQITPAHTHLATNDMSAILDDIARGNIPTGTGQPFPVNWKTDQNSQNPQDPPWVDRTVYQYPPSGGFFNPWKNQP